MVAAVAGTHKESVLCDTDTYNSAAFIGFI